MTAGKSYRQGNSPKQPSIAGPLATALVLFSVMGAVAVPHYVRSIEADLAHRTVDALANSGVDARVTVSGRDVVLLGEVASDEERKQARATVGEVWGVRDVIDRLELAAGDEARPNELAAAPVETEPEAGTEPPPKRHAMRTTLTRSPYGALVLRGDVPSAAEKADWVATASRLYPDDKIVDRLQVVQSDSAWHADCVLVALPWVGKLLNGRVEIGPDTVRVLGMSHSKADTALLQAELSTAGCTADIARLGVVPENHS